MEINRSNVFEIANKADLKPDKDYGQNYLLEPDLCKRIVELLEINDNDVVLEIGPGLGSLTHFICENEKAKISLVDIDKRMTDFLKILYSKNNVEIILNDIRITNVKNYTKIIGNLPYNITTETVIYLLENVRKAKRLVLMCQAEAFPRFFELNGKEYGPSSILVHLLGESKRKFVVKPGSFYPMPKCSSVVFTIDIKDGVDYEYCLSVYDLSKKLFLNRSKTIHNNLSSYLSDKNKSMDILNQLNIPANKRPEELSPETYKKLFDAIQSY